METYSTKPKRSAGMVLRIAGMVIGGVAIAVLFAFLFGYFVMLLWNWLMPMIFGLGEITYLQAFGLIVLARLLIGGFGHHNHKQKPEDCGKEDHFKNWVKTGKWKKTENRGDHFSRWKSYHTYWESEGKAAFEDWRKRRELNEEERQEDK